MIAIAFNARDQPMIAPTLRQRLETALTWAAAFGVMIFALTTAYGLTQFSV